LFLTALRSIIHLIPETLNTNDASIIGSLQESKA
jgi:hypothetical protein